MSRKSTSDENGDPLDSKKNLGGFFNLTTTAKNKVQKKRKKKGLGEKYPKHVSTTTQLFVGWTSAVVSKSLLTPLERAKVVLQVSHLANYTGFTKPKGALSVLGRIVKDQGLIALYRGNMAMVYLTTSKMIASIGFYDKFKRRLMPAGDNKYSGVNSAWRRVAAAMLSGSITIALSYPFELFFTRITADMNGKGAKRLYSNTFDCFNLTQLEGGFRNWYKASSVAMASIIPSTLIMLPLYDILSNSNAQSSTEQEGNTTGSLIAKYISPRFLTGLITMQLLYPLDTIKRCMMVHGSRGYSSLDGGFFGTLRSINKANGIRGFYKGITIASIKMAPSIYIQLALYDWLKNQSLLKEKEPSLDIIEHTLKLSQGEREKVEA